MSDTKKSTITLDVPDIQHTVPEVFIIETLKPKDENEKRYEGLILSDILRLAGKNPKYYYFQSEAELPHVIGLFRASKYRYLHISAHASTDSVAIGNSSLDYAKFSKYFENNLKLRRLFFSACSIGNKDFVKEISKKNNGMHSIVAPHKDILFSDSAAIWSSLYVTLFNEKDTSMSHSRIKSKIESIAELFSVPFFFATYHSEKNEWRHEVISKKGSEPACKTTTK